MYEDGAEEVLKGCNCGSRFFFFVSKEKLAKIKTFTVSLTDNDRNQIERDVKDMIGDILDEKIVVLDLENIKILKPGQYEISLIDIFKGNPLIYKLEEGKYIIDLASTFKSARH